MEYIWSLPLTSTDPNGTADVYSYTYDENGIRSSKTVNGVTTYFTTKDGVILSQTDGTNTMYFQYDNSGSPVGFRLNGTQYFYLILKATKDFQAGCDVYSYCYNNPVNHEDYSGNLGKHWWNSVK